MACIILHNIMVDHRVENEERPPAARRSKKGETNIDTYNNADDVVLARSAMRARNIDMNQELGMEDDTIDVENLRNGRELSIAHLPETIQACRLYALTNVDEHYQLKTAIMKQEHRYKVYLTRI
eukprot:scaffold73879_cov69-Attheya_sp.AAC.3